MTDPTAAGIVHNGTDHLSSTIRGWNYADGETKLTEADICSLARRLAESRALAPERGGGAEPAPPAAPSGTLDGYGYQQIFNAIADAVSTHGDAPISISVRKFTEALAAAPPPPVPAQAESGEVETWTSTDGKYPNPTHRIRELAVRAKTAEARIRELEGEVARITALHNIELERNCNRDAPDYADRLTLAAETARVSLRYADIDFKNMGYGEDHSVRNHVREALAALSAALGGEG